MSFHTNSICFSKKTYNYVARKAYVFHQLTAAIRISELTASLYENKVTYLEAWSYDQNFFYFWKEPTWKKISVTESKLAK